jgi:hypothetical protein
MLDAYVRVDAALPARLIEFEPFVAFVPEPRVLERLHVAGLLAESDRQAAIARMTHLAVHSLDASWLENGPWDVLLTDDDRVRLLDDVRSMLVPRLSEAIHDDWTSGVYWRSEAGKIETGEDPVEHALLSYLQVFEQTNDRDTSQAFGDALELNRRCREPISSSSRDDNAPWISGYRAPVNVDKPSRSIFADVDERE